MDFFLGLSNNTFTRRINIPAEVRAASFKARDTVSIVMRLHDGVRSVAAPNAGESLIFALKASRATAAAVYGMVDSWEEITVLDDDEEVIDWYYVGSLRLNTSALVGALGDSDKIAAVGELTWSADSGETWQSSNTLAVTIENDVYKGVEGTPEAAATPDSSWVAHGHTQSLTPEQKARARANIGAGTGDGSGGGDGTYGGPSPANTAWGGIPAGTDLTGMTFSEIIEMATVVYQPPAFTAFGVSGLADGQLLEYATALSGSRTFTWSTSNSGNVAANTIGVAVAGGATLFSGSANDGTQDAALTLTMTADKTLVITGTNTQAAAFTRSFTLRSVLPVFWGKSTTRPTSGYSALLATGTKVLMDSSGTVALAPSTAADQYLWVAIPSGSALKTAWYQSALNQGAIGGAVSPGGNLFPAPDTFSHTSSSPAWTQNYRIYVTNYPAAIAGTIELRN